MKTAFWMALAFTTAIVLIVCLLVGIVFIISALGWGSIVFVPMWIFLCCFFLYWMLDMVLDKA